MSLWLKKLLSAKLALIAGILVLGCAPPGSNSNTVSESRMNALKSISLGATSNSGGASAQWNCPAMPNVTLDDNINYQGFDYSGDGDFKVCTHRDTSGKFYVKGQTSLSRVCIYPFATTSSGGVQLKDTPQCFSIGSAGIEVSFKPTDSNGARITYNYMAIVDEGHTNQMDSCLSSSAPCPPHSEGFVQ